MREKPRPSRVPTSRPRKIAGQRPAAQAPSDDQLAQRESQEPKPDVEEADPDIAEAEQPPPEPRGPEPQPTWPDEVAHASRRVTVALAAVIVLLAAIAGGEAWYLWLKEDEPVVSASRPVVISPLTADSVVDTAAKAATEFVSASYQDYDEHVGEVTNLMTDGFAEQYRQTKEDIKKDFIASKTKVSAQVNEQGVVTASSEQVVALLFLTQTTERPKEPLDVVQYRVQVTMVHTSSGWLVSDLKTL